MFYVLTSSIFFCSSLESRDNPFVPGGELSREAEALLSRATIIRDHFYLHEEEKRALREQQQQQQQERAVKHVQIVDQLDDHIHTSGRPLSSSSSTEAVEERVSAQSLANTAAAAPVSSPNGGDARQHQPRENGKVKDAAISPDSDKLTVPDGETQSPATSQPGAGGGAAQPPGGGDLQVHDLDKKKRKSCCSIM